MNPKCPKCGAAVTRVSGAPDPKLMRLVFTLQPCGHRRKSVEIRDGATIPIDVTPLNAGTLAIAERERAVSEEGFTAEHDAQNAAELPWVFWSYADRAVSPAVPDPSVPPTMWPRSPDEWKGDKSELRMWIIVAGLAISQAQRIIDAGGLE